MVEKLNEIFPDDTVFFRGLIDSKERLDNLRIYSDWLEQMNDPIRAQIVRLHIRMANMFPGSHHFYDLVEEREELLQTLRKNFRHTKQWLAAIGFGAIEGCADAIQGGQCPRRWERLPLANDDATARLCHLCNKITRYCNSIETARHLFGLGNRVTVDPRVTRKISDLEPGNLS